MRRLLREWHWHRQRRSLAALELLVMDVDGVAWLSTQTSIDGRGATAAATT